MKSLFVIIFYLLFSNTLLAQTGIGTTSPNPSAKLDVYSPNKGFLPPRVTLTSVSDASTIASPAEGLLVYNLGSSGLQAGYYYWNGANWATIATATSAGNGVTAMDLKVLYSKAFSDATPDSTIGNATGYKFTVPVSGRYLFDFTSGAYANSSTFTLTFKVRQGTTDLATDAQTSANNTVHVEYNGKLEVSLQAGITYNVIVQTTGVRNAGDYDRVYYKLVAGNLPVIGQTVDYAMASLSTNQSITAASNIQFNMIQGAGITLNNGGFNLIANKTYKLEGAVGGSSTGYIYYAWVDASNTIINGGSVGTVMKAGTAYTDGPQDKAVAYYTPTSNTTVYLRVLSVLGTSVAYPTSSTPTYSSTWASITQIGTSAIINPWVFTGNDVYNITGKVGIGNNSPTVTLDVTGDAKVSGVLAAGGNTYPTNTGTNGYALTTNAAGAASWNAVPPVGVITAFAGNTAPTGYLICDGAAVSRTTYVALFTIIGTTYGVGNGSTTFNLPDLRSKTIIGVGQGAGLTNRTLASTGGAETKTLTTTELPNHTHTINDPGHAHSQVTVNDDFNNSGGNPPGFTADGAGSRTWYNINSNTTGISINSSGSGAAFNIMNPFISLNYIIKF